MIIYLLLTLILANSWIWKIAVNNIFICILLIFSTIFLFKKWSIFFLLTFILTLYFQILTTTPQSLTILDNDEKRVKTERLSFYNPGNHYVRVIFSKLEIKEFLEGDFNIGLVRLQRNFFETIDPNIYFFAGHPRERVWASDFEKFPFAFIAPFLLGIYEVCRNKNKLFIGFLAITIIVLSVIGHKNNLGPFLTFPFIVILIYEGILKLIKLIRNK